jgi:hypothetical protein
MKSEYLEKANIAQWGSGEQCFPMGRLFFSFCRCQRENH